ncbi:MAG: methyltransferase domain-containing protein [Crocinitomicaceae bacterium]
MSKLNADYWSSRYQQNDAIWDLGEVSPPLKSYIDQLSNKDIKILIPGCGRAYEGIYLWNQGFKNVYLADFSPEAIRSIQKNLPELPKNQILQKDFFTIDGQFDLLVEQTMFCAIDPSLREKYIQKTSELLGFNGKMVGLLFNRAFEGGPPFGGSKQEYEELFSTYYQLKIMDECYNSVAPRKGTELFFIALKK